MMERGLMIVLFGLVLVLEPFPVGILAQSGGPYTLDWWTVDGGGVTALVGAGGYALGSTAGQADARVWESDEYVLVGGFWGGGEVTGAEYDIYLPLALRNS